MDSFESILYRYLYKLITWLFDIIIKFISWVPGFNYYIYRINKFNNRIKKMFINKFTRMIQLENVNILFLVASGI